MSMSPVAILAPMPMRRLEARAAGLHQRDAGRRGRELGAEHGLAREIEILGVRDDRAADDLVDVHALQVVLVDETVERRRHHVEVRQIGVKRVRAAERSAHSANDADAPHGLRHEVSISFLLPVHAEASMDERQLTIRPRELRLLLASLALKCSGPPRNGAKPVPKITPASTRSARIDDLLVERALGFDDQRLDQLAAEALEISRLVGLVAASRACRPSRRRSPRPSSCRGGRCRRGAARREPSAESFRILPT